MDNPEIEGAATGAEPQAEQLPLPAAGSPLSQHFKDLRQQLAEGKLPEMREEGAAAPPVEGGAAPAEGDPAAEPAAGAEGEPAAEGEGEGAPAAEGEQPAGEHAEEELVVRLTPRNAGEEPLEIVMADKATADLLRANIRDGMRRDKYFAAMGEVQKREEDLARFEDEMAADPVLFVTERLGERFRVDAVRHLLSLPGVYEALQDELSDLAGEESRRTVTIERKNERLERKGTWEKQVTAGAKSREQARVLTAAIDRMIPDTLADEDVELLRADLRRDAADYVTRNRVASLHPDDLPRILGRRLKQYGISEQDAKAALSVEGPPPVRVRTAAGAAAKPAGRNAPPDAAAARQTGAKLTQQVATRRAAAAVPGSGTGAPPAAPALPKGQNIQERVKTLRQRLIGG